MSHLLGVVVAAVRQRHGRSARTLDRLEHVEIFLEAPRVRRIARHGYHSSAEAGEVGHGEVKAGRINEETSRALDKAQLVQEVGCERIGAPEDSGISEGINLRPCIIQERERGLRGSFFGPVVDGTEEALSSLHPGDDAPVCGRYGGAPFPPLTGTCAFVVVQARWEKV